MDKTVKVGVGVIVVKYGMILLGKRIGSHGEGTWSLPGGHMEFGESFEQTAKREVFEETGVQICNVKKCGFTNDIFVKENKHYITIFVRADYESGTVTLMEKDKCLEWKWFYVNKLPSPLFLCFQNFVYEYNLVDVVFN